MRSLPQLFVRKYTDQQWLDRITPGVDTPAQVRNGETNDWVLLDLYPSEPIVITSRVQDVIEPTIAASGYSQTLRIPNTNSNGRFFQAVFNVNATYFDPSKKCQAYINDNGSFFMYGCIQLMNVYFNDHSQNIEYEITFLGETSDFASQIGITTQGFLKDLDFTPYGHQKTLYNVVNSWDQKLSGVGDVSEPGDILYPLIEWGYDYAGSGSSTAPVQPTLSIGGAKSFTSSSHALRLQQMKPCLRLKAIWDTIFRTTEYTYESQFLSSNEFRDLYVISDSVARAEVGKTIGFKANNVNGFIYTSGMADKKITLQTPAIYDYAGNYNFDTQVFRVSAAGNYAFTITAEYEFLNPTAPDGTQYATFSLKGGGGTFTFTSSDPEFYTPVDQNGTLIATTNIYNFAAGQEFSFYFHSYGLGKIAINSVSVHMTTVPSDANVDMSNFFQPNIKQIDFMRSVVERFKLVFVPSKDKSKHFNIVPWNTWIQQGSVKDWSSKVNGNVDFKISPLFQTQTRFKTFKDDEDADYLNFNWQQQYKQTYGQLNLDSGIEVIKGTSDVQGIFAPMPIAPIGYSATATVDQIQKANKFLIPHIAKDTASNDGPGKREPIQPKLRLTWYNGKCGVSGPGTYSSTSWFLASTLEAGPGDYMEVPYIPLVSSYYKNPWDGANPFLLDWSVANTVPWLTGTDDPVYSTNPTGQTSFNNFNRYWLKWYEAAYGNKVQDPNTGKFDYDFSMILDCEFVLNYEDIKQLNFNDFIFIKDAYYLINQITFPLNGQTNSCKAQLYKINNLGVYLPTPYSPIPNVCYSASSLCSAVCCDTTTTSTILYTNNPADIGINSRFYVDIAGTIYASPGYYRIGTTTYTVGAFGIVTAEIANSAAECTCIPTLNSKTLCYEPPTIDFCLACCCLGTSATYWMADASSTWYTNKKLYTSSSGTYAVTDGWYSDGTHYVKIQGGVNVQSGTCTSCNCAGITLKPYGCCYDAASKCTAVCCFADNSQTFYGNGNTLATSTFLYKDIASTPASNGWYWDGTSAVQVTGGAGEITTVSNGSSCYPCATELIPVYFGFSNTGSSVTGTFSLQKSFDLSSWVTIQDFDLATIGTPYNYTGGVQSGTYIRGSFSYTPTTQPNTLVVKNQIDGSIISTSTTNPKTYSTVATSSPTVNFAYNLNITANPYDCRLSDGSATKCVAPSCIIDTNTTVNVDATFCCDPVIVNEGDTLFITGATGTVNGNC
jgi:hypothetical protein